MPHLKHWWSSSHGQNALDISNSECQIVLVLLGLDRSVTHIFQEGSCSIKLWQTKLYYQPLRVYTAAMSSASHHDDGTTALSAHRLKQSGVNKNTEQKGEQMLRQLTLKTLLDVRYRSMMQNITPKISHLLWNRRYVSNAIFFFTLIFSQRVLLCVWDQV